MRPIRRIRWASPQQFDYWKAGPNPLLALGGFDAAKTWGGILKLLRLLDLYKNSRAAVVRSTFKHLRKTTMETFYALLPQKMYEHGRRSDQDGVCQLNNGSLVYFMGLDKPESMDVLAGLELNFAFFDQLEQVPERAWDTADARLGRWSSAEIPKELLEKYDPWPWTDEEGTTLIPPPYLFGTANPPEAEDHWLFRRFAEESEERDFWKAQGYTMIHMPSYSNRFASKANLAKLRSKDSEFVRRFYEGLWADPKGAIFTIDKMSILEPHPDLINRIRNTMRLHRFMDHGDTNPTCVGWAGIDHDNNIFVYREHYAGGMVVSDHREIVYKLSYGKCDCGCKTRADVPVNSPTGKPHYVSNMADPAIFAKSRGRSVKEGPKWSVADEWTDSRIMDKKTVVRWAASPIVRGQEGFELVTRNRMKEYLKVDPNHRHPITGKLGAPHIYFIKKTDSYPHGCFYIVKEIKNQRRLKIGERDGRSIYGEKRDETIPDHGYDATKYLLMSRPAPTRIVEKKDPNIINVRELMDWTARRQAARNFFRAGGY